MLFERGQKMSNETYPLISNVGEELLRYKGFGLKRLPNGRLVLYSSDNVYPIPGKMECDFGPFSVAYDQEEKPAAVIFWPQGDEGELEVVRIINPGEEPIAVTTALRTGYCIGRRSEN